MRYRRTISREEVNILVQLVNLDALIHFAGMQAINTAELEIYLEEIVYPLKNIYALFVFSNNFLFVCFFMQIEVNDVSKEMDLCFFLLNT